MKIQIVESESGCKLSRLFSLIISFSSWRQLSNSNMLAGSFLSFPNFLAISNNYALSSNFGLIRPQTLPFFFMWLLILQLVLNLLSQWLHWIGGTGLSAVTLAQSDHKGEKGIIYSTSTASRHPHCIKCTMLYCCDLPLHLSLICIAASLNQSRERIKKHCLQ